MEQDMIDIKSCSIVFRKSKENCLRKIQDKMIKKMSPVIRDMEMK